MPLNQFNSVPMSVPKRHKHNLSHSVKTTLNQGELIPILMQDVIPNDRFKLSLQSLIRLAPMLAPAFSEINVQFHFFFVPNRIIWTKWEDFITQAHNGRMLSEDELPQPPVFVFSKNGLNYYNDQSNFATLSPNLAITQFVAPLNHNSLGDNIGFQTWRDKELSEVTKELNTDLEWDQMPFRAYYKVWSDYFKDENLMVNTDYADMWFDLSGPLYFGHGDTSSGDEVHYIQMLQIRHRCWKKDYFTSALPWAQKGDDVLIPVSSDFSLSGNGSVDVNGSFSVKSPRGGLSISNVQVGHVAGDTDFYLTAYDGSEINRVALQSNEGGLSVNVSDISDHLSLNSTADAGTIRELRRAIAAQKFLERRAIGGSRYVEQNLAFFGARSSDGRLQRAQFLGGYSMPVVVSQLLQTSETTKNSPLGTPAGNGVSAGSSYIFDKSFEEYGWIVGLMSIRPKADYIQGIPRKFLRKDIYDYYWPQFARIGEQPIMNQELFFDAYRSLESNQGTFGYSPRYAEYRFNNNRICGDFKDTLKFWTLGRDFDDQPKLNSQFVTCNPSNRIFAVTEVEFKHFWADVHFNISALRPIPKYSDSL